MENLTCTAKVVCSSAEKHYRMSCCPGCAGLSLGISTSVLQNKKSIQTAWTQLPQWHQEPCLAILLYTTWGKNTHSPKVSLVWWIIIATLAMNAVSWRSYGHSLIFFFLAIFCLQSITSPCFLLLFGNTWVYAFLLESLLPVLVSSHQYSLLETFKRVRFSALKFQSCTKILKGWEWAWK